MKKSVMSKGYVAIYIPDHPSANNRGYVLYHRWLVEQSIGRYLLANEEVHHIDLNPLNNDLNNLRVMTKAEHAVLHGALRRKLDYDLIRNYMNQGYGYKKIASLTGYKVSSVQSAVRALKKE